MSAKLRITAWITLMMLLLAALTLVFVLVVNHNAITDDPAGRLVKVVQKNVDDVEFDRGKFEWDDLSMYSRGVYCMFYDTDGEFIRGAKPDSFDENTPLDPNVINTADIDGETYYIYDSYVDMDVTGLWVRGLISAEDRSGLMHTIITSPRRCCHPAGRHHRRRLAHCVVGVPADGKDTRRCGQHIRR